MGKREKNKGSRFERSFCRELSLAWSGGKDDSIFWRRATFKQKGKTFQFCGDIVQINTSDHPRCRCVFELKKRKDFRVEDFLTGTSTGLLSWWKQTLNETPPDGVPVLVAHRDYGPTLVITPLSCEVRPRLMISTTDYTLFVYRAKDFLEVCLAKCIEKK